ADPEDEYFADGLSEELLNVLAQVPAFRVVSRTSSFAMKGQNIELREIGERLGVSHLLEGSVRRSGERVRITAQLIRGDDGLQLWSQSYDRLLDDVFVIQDDIAASVVQALEVVLDESTRHRMETVGIRNVAAFTAFQKGMEDYIAAHETGPTVDVLEQANVHFDQAIEEAPDFAAAYYYKVDYFAHLLIDSRSDFPASAAAISETRRLLEAAHRHAKDPVLKAFIGVDRVLFSEDWTALDNRVSHALSFDACPLSVWIVNLTPFYSEAMTAMYRRQQKCDPMDPFVLMLLSMAMAYSGNGSAALTELDAASARLGNTILSQGVRILLLTQEGRSDLAYQLAQDIPQGHEMYGLIAKVFPLAAQGEIDAAREAMQRIQDEHPPLPQQRLIAAAAIGDRVQANEIAAELDERPAGPMRLLYGVYFCGCGAPFELSSTPNFARRIAESGLSWPPPELIDFPAKDW
ncbi:MAG TPA: hypothetical protein VE175_15890, partial [Woeseiaceae bacterium]|nr:hypothetical protein [Woeseiaceae bacterium]